MKFAIIVRWARQRAESVVGMCQFTPNHPSNCNPDQHPAAHLATGCQMQHVANCMHISSTFLVRRHLMTRRQRHLSILVLRASASSHRRLNSFAKVRRARSMRIMATKCQSANCNAPPRSQPSLAGIDILLRIILGRIFRLRVLLDDEIYQSLMDHGLD